MFGKGLIYIDKIIFLEIGINIWVVKCFFFFIDCLVIVFFKKVIIVSCCEYVVFGIKL